jgi:DNA-binding XRE family transcriptional regulator
MNNFYYWLRLVDPDSRNELAQAAGCSVNGLYAIASGRRPNPSIKRAMDIVTKIEGLNERLRAKGVPMPDVTIEHLYDIAKKV